MTRPRECTTENGQAKKRWDTRAEAKRVMRLWLEVGESPGKPYRCSVCGYFHLGHYPSGHKRRGLRNRNRS